MKRNGESLKGYFRLNSVRKGRTFVMARDLLSLYRLSS